MSDAKSLEKEIKYWSVLIQQHKDARTNGRQSQMVKKSAPSKYSWKKVGGSDGRGPDTASSATRVNIQGNQRKRVLPDPSLLADKNAQSKDTNAAAAGKQKKVSFDSKFKWSKTVAPGASAVIPKESASVPQQTKTGTVKPQAPARAAANNLKFNPKFKWTKDSAQSPSSQGSVTDSKPIFPTTKTAASQKTALSSNHTAPVLAGAPLPRPVLFTVNQPATSSAYGNNAHRFRYGGGKAQPHARFSTNLMWHGRHRYQKWHSKRHMTKVRPNYSSNKRHLKITNANPYKLDRVGKTSLRVNPQRSVKSSRPIHGQNFTRKNSRVLDRRNLARYPNSSNLAEGVHIHKHSPTMKQVLASRAVSRSHQTTTARLKKDNKKKQHCLYFGRFGKCMRGDSCKFIHDPSRVAVCTRFLRGTCRNKNCSFSHKLEKEKTPVCLFFIRGKCTNESCPYLHVYLGKNAPVCPKFANNGFCAEADQCKALHIKCCPEFYESGYCAEEKDCKLPHLTRKIHSIKTEKDLEQRKNETEKAKADSLQSGLENKLDTSSAPSTSATPDFLSLKVDSPQPLNKPFKEKAIQIKPRFGMLKLKNPSSS